jgi:mannitol-1-phosphate/altronate dehydrogenase
VGYQWKLFNRIKAESLILWDVIQVLRGDRKSMPKSYANKITQRFYNQKNQAKVRQIIQESLAISMERKLRTEKELNEYKIKLKKMENERIDVITHMAFLSQKLNKWGKLGI